MLVPEAIPWQGGHGWVCCTPSRNLPELGRARLAEGPCPRTAKGGAAKEGAGPDPESSPPEGVGPDPGSSTQGVLREV